MITKLFAFFSLFTPLIGNCAVQKYHHLSSSQSDVIIHKGTEPPGSGAFNHHTDRGIYTCRRCDFPLYLSDSKFSCGCGWPSFDDQIEDHVATKPDRDGKRTEIVCARCQAHLGHLFLNEGLTPKNRRHCVNSISLSFESNRSQDGFKRALVAGGCFWGIDHLLKSFHGVISVSSGYTGGHSVNPSYEEVCSGMTGHAEAVEIIYSDQLTYENLLKFFLEIHNPTERNRQGPDIGSQYRSAIFYFDDRERKVALNLLNQLSNLGFKPVTEVSAASHFYQAESYHQNYYAKSGKQPYCHARVRRFDIPQEKSQ